MKQNGKYQPLNVQLEEYDNIWSEMMLKIWQDRITLFHAKRTGTLFNSIQGGLQTITDDLQATLKFDFKVYGIYIEHGSGYGYDANNQGGLQFLDPVYRAEHRLNRRKKVGPAWGGYLTSGHPRIKRPWMSPSWGISRRVMGEAMTGMLGQHFFGMCDVFRK